MLLLAAANIGWSGCWLGAFDPEACRKLLSIPDGREPVAIAVLPDHPTPCKLRTHTAEPVPFLIYYPGIEPDGVQTFDEEACKDGVYGVMKENEFMNEFMSSPQITRIDTDF